MRFLARYGPGLCGLALVASAVAKADDAPAPPGDSALPQASPAPGHQHKGLFGWRHCVECQRAWTKKHDGVDIPPPPSGLPAGVMPGQVVHDHNLGAGCADCPPGAVVRGPLTVVESYPPGRAVVGGPVVAGDHPPGYAVVGGGAAPAMTGSDPTPVGLSRAGQTHWNTPRTAVAGPRPGAGSYDPALLPSSMIPPQTALDNSSTGRPHVISHLLGIGGISRHIQETREEKRREAHASISYDPPAQSVNELPSSMVYGKGH
jgi:hypothetical protein